MAPFSFLFIPAIGLARDLRIRPSGLYPKPGKYYQLQHDPDCNDHNADQDITHGYFPLVDSVSDAAFAALPFGFLMLS